MNAPHIKVNAEMVSAIQMYVDDVRARVASSNGVLLVEQKLPIFSITGEAQATGTSDVVIITRDELIIEDLKYGRGVVVEADNNPQLMIYALSALRHFAMAGDFKTVRVVIHQPRLHAVSEAVYTVGELEEFGAKVLAAAAVTRFSNAPLVPSNAACKFCKAKPTCPALRKDVVRMFDATPNPATAKGAELAAVLAKAEMVDAWIKAVRAEVETRLLDGQEVPGFKVVMGKKGNRSWSDKEAAAEMLLSMRLPHDHVFEYSLISPTEAEKMAKLGVISEKQWPLVKQAITQSAGRPTVAPQSDKRPAISIADDFDDLTPAVAGTL